MDAREFRQIGHQVVDLLSEYFQHIEEKPVFPDVEPQVLTRLFDEPLPQAPSPAEEVLSELEPQTSRHPLPLRVAFHDSCHLQHAQRVRQQPRSLLAQIPELELLEIGEAAICCGSAGIYNLVQPHAANALGDRKAQLIAPLKADVTVTGNPGCILQLQSALARLGTKTPVLHTIQLLDASIRSQSVNLLEK